MRVFCPKCGTEIGFEARFCPNCGKGFCESSASVAGPAVASGSNGKRKTWVPILAVCAAVLLLAAGVAFWLFGELSKGSLEGHTAASVSATVGSKDMTCDLDLNANNGSFALEIGLSDRESWSGASYSKLWLNGSYDCSKSGSHESYSWTVEDIKCDGAVPQSELEKLKEILNSLNSRLEYDGSFPNGEWKLDNNYRGSFSFSYVLNVSEMGTGGTASCGALELAMTVGDADYGSIGVGSWWIDDRISNLSGVADCSYGCSITLEELSLMPSAIWY